MSKPIRILYCHCAYAHVVPRETKDEVLRRLSDSGVAFDAVPDLCEMSARKDPTLKQLAQGDGNGAGPACRIAACYPRAVRWLFSAAGAELPDQGVQIHNMRVDDPEKIVQALLEGADANNTGETADANNTGETADANNTADAGVDQEAQP